MSQGDTVLVDHSDVEVGHQDQDAFALVRSSHRNVVELGSIAQGEATCLVNSVPADPGVGRERLPVDLDDGLVERSPRLHRGDPRAVCGRSSL